MPAYSRFERTLSVRSGLSDYTGADLLLCVLTQCGQHALADNPQRGHRLIV
jgi:hypothetical protein